MGYRHTREELLEAAVGSAFEDGLSQLTFGRLAKRLGVSDRIVVYYFPSKEALISDVLTSLAVRLQGVLAASLSTPVADHAALVRAAWPLLARPSVDPVFAVFFEASGLAAVGREPYRSVVPELVRHWISWASDFITGKPAHRRREAAAAVATLDGLLLLRQLAGPSVADTAAKRLGC